MKIRLFFVSSPFRLGEKKDFSSPCQILLPILGKCACFRCMNARFGWQEGAFKLDDAGKRSDSPCFFKPRWTFVEEG